MPATTNQITIFLGKDAAGDYISEVNGYNMAIYNGDGSRIASSNDGLRDCQSNTKGIWFANIPMSSITVCISKVKSGSDIQ